MSLLQEMEKFGLADCEFNRQLIRNQGLEPFLVTLHEDRGDKFTLFFECWADDIDHAEEQALNAYPNGEIINVIKEK